MFIATSNSMNIPAPLLDRMEVIFLSGYTEDEKVHIAQRHLIPKQVKLNGVMAKELKIEKDAIVDIVRFYTREAGVRGLEKKSARFAVKSGQRSLLKKTSGRTVVTSKNLGDYLGVKRFNFGMKNKKTWWVKLQV